MDLKHIVTTLLLACFLILAGCERPPAETDAITPVAGAITDMAAFDAFIASQPTPEQFRQRYPDVLLVLPDEPATRELRSDNSRFFAELDEHGRIIGGHFS